MPVFQHDFGWRDKLIGGRPPLQKGGRDPVGEIARFGQATAEPSLSLKLAAVATYGSGLRRGVGECMRLHAQKLPNCAQNKFLESDQLNTMPLVVARSNGHFLTGVAQNLSPSRGRKGADAQLLMTLRLKQAVAGP